jgi:hypothetical protein
MFFPLLKRNPYGKIIFFINFFINFSTAFFGPLPLDALPWHHIFPKAAAFVIKHLRKAAKNCINPAILRRLSKPFYG